MTSLVPHTLVIIYLVSSTMHAEEI